MMRPPPRRTEPRIRPGRFVLRFAIAALPTLVLCLTADSLALLERGVWKAYEATDDLAGRLLKWIDEG